MRRLCLGGSFNPIHIGHLICARAAAEAGGFDGVRLIPTAANPHKSAADLAAAEHRLAMCQLAVAGDPFFTLDDREIRRAGPSFTIDTAAELLVADEPVPRVAWLIGTDLLRRLNTWHRFDELLNVVQFIVMARAGETPDIVDVDPRVAALVERIVGVPQIQISSTGIRDRVRAGRAISHLVPPAVERYLVGHNLYRV